MSDKTLARFKELRRKDPLMGAKRALSWARSEAKAVAEGEAWQESSSSNSTWSTEREGFLLRMTWHSESTCPMPDRNGHTEYGDYVQPARHWEDYYPQPRPSRPTPMGLPAELFRSGNRDGVYYFFLDDDDVTSQYDYYRRSGMAKQPARELLCTYVKERVLSLVGGDTDWDDQGIENGYLQITAHRAGVQLGTSGIGSDMIVNGYQEAEAYIFGMLLDYDLADEAIDDARATLAKLLTANEEA